MLEEGTENHPNDDRLFLTEGNTTYRGTTYIT
jgi:hypothetical protein